MRFIAFIFCILFATSLAFAQRDTTAIKRKTTQYTLSEDYTEVVPLAMDTMLTDFQFKKVLDQRTPFYSNLGNYGLPVLELDFFKRTTDPDRFIYRHYLPYMHSTSNKVFIDTQIPFSEIIFTYGGGRTEGEQSFSVRHSQNVNQYLNFGIDLDIIYSLGQYAYQSTNDRSFTLHTSYLGKKYRMFGAWSLNSFTGLENGGLSDETQIGELDTRDLPTKLGGLSNAESVFKYKDLLLVQSYSLGGAGNKAIADSLDTKKKSSVEGTFRHILSWENGKKVFSDDYPGNEFYDTTYITGSNNNVSTFDSLYSRVLRNTLRFDFSSGDDKKFQLDIGVGITNELNVFSQIRPTHDTLTFSDTLNWNESSNALIGSLANRIGTSFGWNASGKLYFTGIKAGDMILKGNIHTVIGKGKWASEIYGRGAFINQGPSFWQNSWGGNHKEWDNDFDKELRINVGGGYRIPGVYLDLSLDYSLISNYIYFNSAALPQQSDASISVLSIRASKLLRFWKFRFNNLFMLQQTSHADIISLPFVTAKSSFYFDHLFYFKITDGRLGFQLGVEGIYNTAYMADNYNPSTGFYYNQNNTETGNYPYLNAFINLKLKRTRIFVAFEHFNYGLKGMGTDYNHVPAYYAPIRMFKYGISWTFYD
ncbi:MAG: putative porin [Bacteroidales bacterium]|nr:putative porin [Bacteroidales bacterium]